MRKKDQKFNTINFLKNLDIENFETLEKVVKNSRAIDFKVSLCTATRAVPCPIKEAGLCEGEEILGMEEHSPSLCKLALRYKTEKIKSLLEEAWNAGREGSAPFPTNIVENIFPQ